jgi:hypothetical protein
MNGQKTFESMDVETNPLVNVGMTISPPEHGEFEDAIRRTVARFKPRNVIETGTYLGNGTTRVLHDALKSNGPDFTFVTIEAQYTYWKVASAHYRNNPEVVCLHGLSIPRSNLPTRDEIQKQFVDDETPGIYFDHPKEVRAALYMKEQETEGPDKLLWVALGAFGFRPDLVLLDSAGHLGFLEFTYLMKLVKSPFVLVLDDVRHCKHNRTANSIVGNSFWEVIETGTERFGWLVARFKAGG